VFCRPYRESTDVAHHVALRFEPPGALLFSAAVC
jgi:hypothetical protein